ncbi:MAG: hypothetical protein KGI59_01110 [Patescibacteria group bacterium]|nr:hypothetical protein [Patescibacteria group bacterium]
MQHTLLPQPERRALRREYRIRALIVLCFTLSVAGLLGVASVLPAYFGAMAAEHSAENDLVAVKHANTTSGLTSIQQKVADGVKLLSVLDLSGLPPDLSVVIDDVVSTRGSIRIDSLTAAHTGTTTIGLTILGVAPTRDMLTAWKDTLASTLPGATVNLPISELAQATNVDFSIQISAPFK